MTYPKPLTTEFVEALFDAELARRLNCFYEEDLRNIETNQKTPAAPLRKQFLLKLLNDAERFGLGVECCYCADDLELTISNGEAGSIDMVLDYLDNLKIDSVVTRQVFILSPDDDSPRWRTGKMACGYLLKHGFEPLEFCGQFSRDYRPFDLNTGFEFELGWFSDWIETTNRLVDENEITAKQFRKMKKIAELKNELHIVSQCDEKK